MKRELRPLSRHRIVSGLAFFLLLVTFLFLFLASISLPVVKPIYLLSVKANIRALPFTSVATELRFGVWGVCASSLLNVPSFFSTNSGECYGPQLGYAVPDYLLDAAGISRVLGDAIQHGLLGVLVLHPIAAVFAFFSFSSSLCLGTHMQAICALVLTIITTLFTTIVMAVDIAFVVVARSKVSNLLGSSLTVQFGNAVYLVIFAAICSWAAVLVLAARSCYCCGVRKHRHDHEHY